ncbi:MAG TPA: pre-peptidase C-terminal domain-containing protein [Pyrinomonadaceae bacterium]|nr:pre-peptidase C-terminal domain-containing protein [Pyrinomonadaceae bacterium]
MKAVTSHARAARRLTSRALAFALACAAALSFGASRFGASAQKAARISLKPTVASPGKRASVAPGRGKFKPGGAKAFAVAKGGGAVSPLALGCANPDGAIAFGQTVNGALQSGDCTLPSDGSFFDAYTFGGTAGQQVSISMTSLQFDTYLYLLQPGETSIGGGTIQDDDGGGGTDSLISVTLPSTGTYTILATSFVSGATGSYSLSLNDVTPCTPTTTPITPVSGGTATATGALSTSDCHDLGDNSYYDVYTFSGTAGQQVAVAMSSSFDNFLFLIGPDGDELARDDDGGGGTNARIPAGTGFARLPQTGTYRIVANSALPNVTGSYTVSLAVAASPCPSTPINFNETKNGTLGEAGDCRLPADGSFIDVYTFGGAAGQAISITMNSNAFDAFLFLLSPTGSLIAEDDNGSGTTNARIPAGSGTFTLPANGTYTIYANSSLQGETGAYTLTLNGTPVASALRIDAVAPPAGRASGGQQVKLTGAFAGASSVTVGGVAASFTFTNGTSEITLTTPPHAAGAVTITVSTSTGETVSKTNAFAYLPTVFTDDTLVAGVTTAKAQHILELRAAVDALRLVAGLSPAPWTDATLTPGATVIKAVHVLELRTYLDDAAQRLGYPAGPAYSNPSLGAGSVIRRLDIEELRQRVRAIAG